MTDREREDQTSEVVGENKEEEKVFPCNFCDKIFHCPQALGGHQNAHRRERSAVKKQPQDPHHYPVYNPFNIAPPPPYSSYYQPHNYRYPLNMGSPYHPTRYQPYNFRANPYPNPRFFENTRVSYDGNNFWPKNYTNYGQGSASNGNNYWLKNRTNYEQGSASDWLKNYTNYVQGSASNGGTNQDRFEDNKKEDELDLTLHL